MSIVRLRSFNWTKAKRRGYKTSFTMGLLYGLIEIRSKVKVWDEKHGHIIPYNIVHTLLDSNALTWKNKTAWLKQVHTEIEFSETYRGLSFSATTIDDGPACCRLKKILYSHAEERWDTVEFEVTPEQERKMFEKACEMADVYESYLLHRIEENRIYDKDTFHGPNAVKYDKAGVFLSNIHPARIIGGSSSKVWCTEAACYATNAGELTNLVPDMQIPAPFHIRMMQLSRTLAKKGNKV